MAAVLTLSFIIAKIGYNTGLGAAPPPAPAEAGSAQPLAAMGQQVRDGNFRFVVTSVDVSKTASDPSIKFEIAPKQGEFVNVHLTVSNVGDRPESFFAYGQTLQIGANQFSSNNEATMWKQGTTVEINPGNSVQAVVSFDVPSGTPTDGVLTVHGSLSSGGAKIRLR